MDRSQPFQNLASDATLEQWLLQHITHTAHSSGTCKMGPTAAALAVVDQYCRVHGLEDLRVVDASVASHYTATGCSSSTGVWARLTGVLRSNGLLSPSSSPISRKAGMTSRPMSRMQSMESW